MVLLCSLDDFSHLFVTNIIFFKSINVSISYIFDVFVKNFVFYFLELFIPLFIFQTKYWMTWIDDKQMMAISSGLLCGPTGQKGLEDQYSNEKNMENNQRSKFYLLPQ